MRQSARHSRTRCRGVSEAARQPRMQATRLVLASRRTPPGAFVGAILYFAGAGAGSAEVAALAVEKVTWPSAMANCIGKTEAELIEAVARPEILAVL